MNELGDKLSDSDKKDVEAAIADLEEAIKGDDKAAIEQKTQVLAERSGKLAERLYAQSQGAGGAEQSQDTAGAAGGDDVVDAEFEEVKEDRKQ